MTTDSLKTQISIANNATLKAVYEHCCEEYRKRLCEQWEIPLENATWSLTMCEGLLYIDFIGGIVLDIDQIILLVSNGIKLADFIRYWDYASKTETGVINMKNWFLYDVRPRDYERKDNTDEK